ncbi:MAG: methyltransferase domain-containing protein [Chloroflexota bacterium]|nr:methyltransferase domain-containing protein [Chloroflexota bacterium]MDE2883587.1 methyltransferase domain-containing protein [Chloroflexota bacterium]
MPFDFPYDDWADIYDAVYADLTHDVDFYVELARESGGPVLELGCGTGRISLAIAREGIAVTGIDISPRMVAVAQDKAARRGVAERCVFQSGDMATLQLAERYPLVIMPFRSFQSMLTTEEQRQALARVRERLAHGGLVALDTFNPDVNSLVGDHASLAYHLKDVEREDGGTLVVWGQNGWDPVTQVNEVRLIIEEVSDEGVVERRLMRDFEQRYTFRYEMEHLLELCGFDLEAVYGDFDGGPVTEETEDLVWVARVP